MAVSPSDFLKIGRELIDREGEIDHRTAANRAYYAAFHFCETVAKSLPSVPVRGKGSHEKVISRLKDHQVQSRSRERDKKIRTLGHFLAKAKVLRVHADYELSEDFDLVQAEQLLLTAEKIRDVVAEINVG